MSNPLLYMTGICGISELNGSNTGYQPAATASWRIDTLLPRCSSVSRAQETCMSDWLVESLSVLGMLLMVHTGQPACYRLGSYFDTVASGHMECPLCTKICSGRI